MDKLEDDYIYDEEESVKFIRNYLPIEMKERFSDDDIYYLVDLIYEFYELKSDKDAGPDSEDVDIHEEELIAYVINNTMKDDIGDFTPDEISFVVKGELAYCDSIGFFDD